MYEHQGYTTQTDKDFLTNAYSRFGLIRTQHLSMFRMASYLRKVAGVAKPVYLDGRIAVYDVQAIAF